MHWLGAYQPPRILDPTKYVYDINALRILLSCIFICRNEEQISEWEIIVLIQISSFYKMIFHIDIVLIESLYFLNDDYWMI